MGLIAEKNAINNIHGEQIGDSCMSVSVKWRKLQRIFITNLYPVTKLNYIFPFSKKIRGYKRNL